MNRRTVLGIAMLLMSAAGRQAMAQHDGSQLRLQVLNGRTGKPVAHEKVTVWGSDGIPKHPGKKLADTTTDGEGFVTLPETTPVPERVIVDMGAFRSCSKTSVNSFPVQTIAASGVVSENACKPRISLYPQAGTLVFFVRPETWLEHMRK